MLKKVASVLCLVGCVAGNASAKSTELMIPESSAINIKVWSLTDGFISNVEHWGGTQDYVNSRLSDQLVARKCDMGVRTAWDGNKHVPTNAVLACAGQPNIEVKGYVLNAKGETGLSEMELGDTLTFVFTERVKLDF
ncbi:hypothetical protein NPS53_08035 [Pseudomonas putida]|uniref:hypothetical protein n=1 Tax=Pseudomonas putida TaxID=303 RepID=UPI0023639AB0|nr:hypothetical protein [Pseudomonas putida]MDD2139519.1 hypothetical protein [Pseudomonas putida]HDS1721847.1 hypothetical protein [Pseudomonas putida]